MSLYNTHLSPLLSPLPPVCHAIHFCKTDPTNDRVLYRRYVSGVMAAWYGTYVQGNPEQLKYVDERQHCMLVWYIQLTSPIP